MSISPFVYKGHGTTVTAKPRLRGMSISTASRSLTSADAMQLIACNSGEATTLTLPTSIEVGFSCSVVDLAGGVIFAAGAGASIVSLGSNVEITGTGGVAHLLKSSATQWILYGDLA